MSGDLRDPDHKISDAPEAWLESTGNTGAAKLAHDAQYAADSERQMSLWEGLKAYPNAVKWSVIISLATVMDGYDTGFLTSLFGLVSKDASSTAQLDLPRCP